MTISLSISSEAEAHLRAKAAAVGKDVATFVSSVVERLARGQFDLHAMSGPLSDEFKTCGMTEDQLTDLLEREKHAARAARRGSNGV